MAAWVASHFAFGAGFVIDGILVAIGYAVMGWAIFGALKKLWKCMKLTHGATSMAELDQAAEMVADALTDFGVELIIGLLTRGAGKMRAAS